MALSTFAKTCLAHMAGATRLIIFDIKKIATATIDAGTLKVLTLDAAGDSVEIPIDRDSLKVISEGTGSKSGVKYVTQAVEFTISRVDKDSIKAISTMADHATCGLGALVYTNNKGWLCAGLNVIGSLYGTVAATAAEGINGLFMPSAVGDTGVDPTDDAGDMFTVRLEGVFPDHVLPVTANSTVTAATTTLIAAAA
jgi:hypothetical protein